MVHDNKSQILWKLNEMQNISLKRTHLKMSFVKGQPWLSGLSGPNLLINPMDFSLLPQDKANSSHRQLYNSVIFEGATLVYRPDCNAEGGCHANSARAKRGRYWLWQPPEALQEGRYTSVAPEQNHAISIITTWSHNVLSFYKLFACGSVPCGALI